jgi:hypothetical protein
MEQECEPVQCMHLCSFHQVPAQLELQVRSTDDFGATSGCDVFDAGDANGNQRYQKFAWDMSRKAHPELVKEQAVGQTRKVGASER